MCNCTAESKFRMEIINKNMCKKSPWKNTLSHVITILRIISIFANVISSRTIILSILLFSFSSPHSYNFLQINNLNIHRRSYNINQILDSNFEFPSTRWSPFSEKQYFQIFQKYIQNSVNSSGTHFFYRKKKKRKEKKHKGWTVINFSRSHAG